MRDNETGNVDKSDGTLVVPSRAQTLLQEVTAALRPFLDGNTKSQLANVVEPVERVAVLYPWQDKSLILLVPEEPRELAEALNNVLLPQRYTAVWHSDTKDLEVIWTAHRLPPGYDVYPARSFEFVFEGKNYNCGFGRSSDRLLTIAKAMSPVGGSDTTYRNLTSFATFAIANKQAMVAQSIHEPICFWVRNIEWSDDFVLRFVMNLNFYMQYFDYKQPHILIHPPVAEGQAATPRTQYPAGEFPKQMRAKPLDDNLLHFWAASREGDPARQFLYCYRIIEYTSSLYIDHACRSSLKMALADPKALDDIEHLTEQVLSAMQKSKLDEYAKYEAVIRETVSADRVWNEIQNNMGAFVSETRFDGGFKVGPLLSLGGRKEDWLPQGLGALARVLRDMRNALSHGKDQKSSAVIAPTTGNFRLLTPWVNLISVMAADVILYQDII
jgi:hypothetical protein